MKSAFRSKTDDRLRGSGGEVIAEPRVLEPMKRTTRDPRHGDRQVLALGGVAHMRDPNSRVGHRRVCRELDADSGASDLAKRSSAWRATMQRTGRFLKRRVP